MGIAETCHCRDSIRNPGHPRCEARRHRRHSGRVRGCGVQSLGRWRHYPFAVHGSRYFDAFLEARRQRGVRALQDFQQRLLGSARPLGWRWQIPLRACRTRVRTAMVTSSRQPRDRGRCHQPRSHEASPPRGAHSLVPRPGHRRSRRRSCGFPQSRSARGRIRHADQRVACRVQCSGSSCGGSRDGRPNQRPPECQSHRTGSGSTRVQVRTIWHVQAQVREDVAHLHRLAPPRHTPANSAARRG
mmetsp:Transcript_31654/g.97858  ORF Transcript_31654/g.97858 Transcript_31654/m.97858 type:complete len:244 (+) Transcript_31654:213-944(+)